MRHHAILPATQLRQARLQLVENGIHPMPEVDFQIAQSWQRSLSAGLSPIGRIDCADNLSGANLQRAKTANHDLISHSEPVMEYLYEQVRQTQSMVILADAQGVLMHTLGDLDFLNKAERVALMSGASWAENQRGTNAIGTALASANEIEIHGAEHYLERNGFLTCAAAPIMSSQGKLMGILDISGDHRSRHPHTLGLVSTAAQMIENTLVMSASRHQILVQLHPRAEGIGSVAQGVLAFSEDGWLVGANRKGLAYLSLQYADVGAISWPFLFDEDFQTMLATQSRAGGRATALRTHRGLSMYVQVHSQTKAQQKNTVTATPQKDALRALDTGDVQWQSAAEKAKKVMDKAIPLLITGESGVGKEFFAQAIHRCSQRRDKAFVAVNCAALPEHLIEAELFGYVPGAFTGASRQGSLGRLREAHEGTLFLDEIGDMPVGLQTRLLRVLQERKVTPLGSSTATPVDFNLICATHQNLKQAVERGNFREDLYYRVNGLTLRLPALRERTDFDALCRRILKEFAPDTPITLAPDLSKAMAAFKWPGNLRQLSHALKAAVALLEDHESQIAWIHLAEDLAQDLAVAVEEKVQSQMNEGPAQNLHDLSMRAIQMALENARGNVSAAARQLGISRQTLYRKLQEI
jgi:transcriptional regulator of acetoin/glycerol metabolism